MKIINKIFHPFWKLLLYVPPFIYGWFAFIRDEFLPEDIKNKLILSSVIDMIDWYWWVIIGLFLFSVITLIMPMNFIKHHQISDKKLSAKEINIRLTERPHKCSYCDYSYLITPKKIEPNTNYLVMDAKCPKCGNTERVMKFYKG
ncbi:MAG: hypothetical protein IIA48_10690 [Bacteroidetes bacterium]|nr:hypothetical protein [Bacteroidota bacterium]